MEFRPSREQKRIDRPCDVRKKCVPMCFMRQRKNQSSGAFVFLFPRFEGQVCLRPKVFERRGLTNKKSLL